MKGPRFGEEFEAVFRDSVPKGTYVRRLRTPTAMGFVVPQLVQKIEQLSALLHLPVPDWVTRARRFRFTPKAGFDFLMTAPAPCHPSTVSCGPGGRREVPLLFQVIFALELKSVDGNTLPFSKVDDGQERALAEAAAAGHLAFLVIEYRGPGEVWAVPIQVWRELRAAATRRSLPVSEARLAGMPILHDPFRGQTNVYLDLAEWIVRCGGMLPEAPPRPPRKKRGAPGAASPQAPEAAPRGLFDPPPTEGGGA